MRYVIEESIDVVAQSSIWGISEVMKPEHDLYLQCVRSMMVEEVNG